jgi:hexosaminidase
MQETGDLTTGNLQLLPRPRRLAETGGSVDPGGLEVRERVDPGALNGDGPEAYRLEVRPDGIVLTAPTGTGLRWARATLAQLRLHPRIPCLVIDDAPRFAHRGVMLDISRDRVPTPDTLRALVDHLAAWKVNHLQLYVEHTLAYAGHEDAWRAASPVTLEELAALDAYAGERGVALTANQNCLGHFERWLRHPRYAPLGERDRGSLVRGEFYVPPNTLCPLDPDSMALVDDLLRQQLPLCSGAYANIGCDEPWDLGTGRSRQACRERGKAAVFSAHVGRVAAIARELGKRPQFWCDPEPNEDDTLPRDLVALVWGYEADTAFAPRLAAHKALGREAWVAPGTSCWNSSTGRTWNRRANLDNAAAARADGFLCTAWGDGGHRQPWPITLFGFADAAMAAWSGPAQYDNRAAGLHAFGSPGLGEWLARLGDIDAELCRGEAPPAGAHPAARVHNATALWREMHATFQEAPAIGDLSSWQAVRQRAAAASACLPAGIDPLVAGECRLAADLALWTADRAILRRGDPQPAPRKELAARMIDLIADHRRQWLARCRYGGLGDSTARFEHFARNG